MNIDWLPGKKEWRGIVCTALSQILLGYFTLFIQSIYPVWSSPFWPASGAALASLILGGPRMILGVYLGLIVLGLKFFWGPYPLWMAFLVPWGNLAETLTAYFLLRYFVPKFDPSFGNIRQLSAFILLCPWVPALTSALSIQLLLQYLGTIPPDRFSSEVAVYSLGNAMGILLITPMILVWRDLRSFSWHSPAGRKILAMVTTLLVGLWLFSSDQSSWLGRLVAVTMIPLTIWGIWITGVRGATLVCLLVSISYFAFDVPGSRPLSKLLEEKQRSAELRFVMEKKLQAVPRAEPPPRLAREISDQIGLLVVICITILPLGVAADELRVRSERDRRAMAALASSFWSWTEPAGYVIENPAIASVIAPETSLFQPNRKTGTLKFRPGRLVGPSYLSHWVVEETGSRGQPIRVSGILQDFSIEEERDAALAQARLAELEIQTLRSHLNPHLLFNCLAGLRGLIAENPERAREFSGHLARFLRAVVDSEKQKTIPLRDEISICEDFVKLEELRGRPAELRIRLDQADAKVPIPPLTLVTLLENATKHGRRHGTQALPVEIQTDRPDPHHLRVRLRQPGALTPPRPGINHAGLDLIRRQLQAVLGRPDSLRLSEATDGHVVAELVLPV